MPCFDSPCTTSETSPRPPVGLGLPEELWATILGFAGSISELMVAAGVSRAVHRASLHGELPARRRLRFGSISDKAYRNLVSKCGQLQILSARTKGVTSFEFPKSLMWLSLTLDTASTLAAALRGCPLLEFLDLRLQKSVSLFRGEPSGQWPLLKALRLDAEEQDQLVEMMDVLNACPALETVAMRGYPRVATWRPRPSKQPLPRLNSESRLLPPPVAVCCSYCGAKLYSNLTSYVLGRGTQSHIAFELYTNEVPENLVAVDSNNTQLNCPRNCHATEFRFLVATRANDFIDTRGFRFAIACGKTLARLEVPPPPGEETPVILDDLQTHQNTLFPSSFTSSTGLTLSSDDKDIATTPVAVESTRSRLLFRFTPRRIAGLPRLLH